MKLTEVEYQQLLARKTKKGDKVETVKPVTSLLPSPTGEQKKRQMNGLETRYSLALEAQKRAGEIKDWKFEVVTLKLAFDCRYTPDFYVVGNDGAIQMHETKGFWRDDALVKIKVAAVMFPEFRFYAVFWDRELKSWRFRNF